ncbi:IMV membrane protein [Equine molluscum contagiosum-like virus]|nr:IMV membrane protein [Equine molluscum contagiosum-like virus]
MEDLNEANLSHLLARLASTDDLEFAATLAAIRELINAINSKVLLLNKKSKKQPRQPEHAARRAGDSS